MSRVRVALFGTMSRTLIAFLAIVHAVRSEQCSAWVEVDTITGSRGAGCSEPPDESYEGSVVGGVDVASAQRICNNACWLGHANSASGLSGSTWSELYPVPHTVIGGIVRNYYCYCWHATCTRTRTTKLKDNGNPTVSEHQTVRCPPGPPPPPSPTNPPRPPLQPGNSLACLTDVWLYVWFVDVVGTNKGYSVQCTKTACMSMSTVCPENVRHRRPAGARGGGRGSRRGQRGAGGGARAAVLPAGMVH